jgi:hypothetical protein
MQVLPVRELPDGGQWTYEAKLDGYRCLVAKRKAGPRYGQGGTIFTAQFLVLSFGPDLVNDKIAGYVRQTGALQRLRLRGLCSR